MEILYSARKWFSDHLARRADRCLEDARWIAPEGHVPESELEKRMSVLEKRNDELTGRNIELEKKAKTYEDSVEEMRQDFVRYFRMMGLDRERLEEISYDDLLYKAVSRYKNLVQQLKSTVSKLSRGETEDIAKHIMLNFSQELFCHVDLNLFYTSPAGIIHLRSRGAEAQGYKGMKIADLFYEDDAKKLKEKMMDDVEFEDIYRRKKDNAKVKARFIPCIVSEKPLSYLVQIDDIDQCHEEA